jgi:hypothetical protein
MDEKLLAALIGASVACVGWIVTDFLSRRTEEEKRRNDAALGYIESQIRDLYGPLLGLIQQSENIYEVARRLLPGPLKDTRKDFPQFSEDQSQSWVFFVESYFIPIHEQAPCLISSKTHLLEQTELPKSLRDFLNYAADLECRHKLYLERKIDTRSYEAAEYPACLKTDLEAVIKNLADRRQKLLRQKGITG